MKQVIQNYRSGEFEVADVPVPALVPGTLLVQSRVSLISAGTERQLVQLARASLVGKAVARPDLVRRAMTKMRRDGIADTVQTIVSRLDTPAPLGYSLAGVVIGVDPSVTGFAVGDRVACAGAGHANHAEINTVPKRLCAKLPPEVSDEDAAFVTLGAIALQGVRQAQPTLDERFVVIGLGLVGQLTVQILKANGCRVIGCDPDSAKVELAKKLGADSAVEQGLTEAVSTFTDGAGADAVIVAASSSSDEPLRTAAEVSRAKGRVVVVGMVGMNLDREPFYRKELDLRLSMSYGPGRYDPAYEEGGHDYPIGYVRWTEERNMGAFIHLIASGKVTPAALASHRYPIADALDAYRLLTSGEPCLGILLTYPQETPVLRRLPAAAAPHIEAGSGGGIGVIGAGSFAKTILIPLLQKLPAVTLTGVATTSGISARHAATKFGFRFATTDTDEVLADAATDTVLIATRHASHAQLVRSALERGKHVFCEKPLALTRTGLQDALAAAAAARKILTVGFNRRCAPHVLAIKAAFAVRNGPLIMSYRVNAGSPPATSWLLGEEGGGRVVGEMCHFVDTMMFLAGEPVIGVTAARPAASGDSVIATLTFGDGSMGTITYSAIGDASSAKEYLEVFAAGRVAVLDDFRRLSLTVEGRRRRLRALARDKGHKGLLAAFVKAARGEGPPPMTLAEIGNVTATTFAIEQAIREKREIAVGNDEPS